MTAEMKMYGSPPGQVLAPVVGAFGEMSSDMYGLADVIAAAMTSFYSWRLMFLTFYGEARGDKHTHEHAHESPMVMLIPLGVLAIGAIFSGMVFYKSFFEFFMAFNPNYFRKFLSYMIWSLKKNSKICFF
mgnify:CR=1 FL=1